MNTQKKSSNTINYINDQMGLFSYGGEAQFATFDIEANSEADNNLKEGDFPQRGVHGISNIKEYKFSFEFVKKVYEISFGSRMDKAGNNIDAIDANFSEKECLMMLEEMSNAFAEKQNA